MDDDYQDKSGFGSLAWYQIGRWSAEVDQEHQRTLDHVSGRGLTSRTDYDYALRMNQALAAENRRLSEEIAGLKRSIEIWRDDHERLDKWAHQRAAEAEIWKGNYWALKNRS